MAPAHCAVDGCPRQPRQDEPLCRACWQLLSADTRADLEFYSLDPRSPAYGRVVRRAAGEAVTRRRAG